MPQQFTSVQAHRVTQSQKPLGARYSFTQF